ncbi:hypothetical protein KIN20_014416 [Parelaphostrongylus tenuis]|uniref:tRNA-intron lyase n=1 Tax=Parelaphostrongylus tenuis TaxID=148309 RepID=A0AAD5MXB7_PARTN|nr:hypothetical protein KIN20_014416 [Parelaphostrongylus tenuis]
MNLIKHRRKFGSEDIGAQVPLHRSRAIIYGGSIIVPDERSSEHIYTHGGYGHYIDEKEDRTNARLFPEAPMEGSSERAAFSEERRQWSEKSPLYERLRLSPEETVYLSIDANVLEVCEKDKILTQKELWSRMRDLGGAKFLKKYVAYRFLRRNGWCVRCGLPYGCDYLIYRGNPSSYHAAAGVKIESSLEPRVFVGLNRVLTNMKKALIILTVMVPEALDETKPCCADSVHISMSTSTTMFVERKMNDMKAQECAKIMSDVLKEH